MAVTTSDALEIGRSRGARGAGAPDTAAGRTIGIALIVALVAAPGGVANGTVGWTQSLENDFYLHESDSVDVVIYLDSLGILPRPGVSAGSVQQAVSDLNLSPAGQLAEPILVFGLPQPQSRAQLHELARNLENDFDALIGNAGPLMAIGMRETRVAVTDQVIVQFGAAVTDEQIDSLNAALSVEQLVSSPLEPNHFLVRVTASSAGDALTVAQLYNQSPSVVYAYPNFLGGAIPNGVTRGDTRTRGARTLDGTSPTAFVPNDPLFPEQWFLRNTGQLAGTPGADVKAVPAWDLTQGDPSTVIAVIEICGFDDSHPDLSPNVESHIVFGPCTGGNSILRHATAVAGLAAAVGNNGLGVTGMCPKCRLMLIQAGGPLSNKVNAFHHARNNNASVINASWSMITQTPIANAIVSAANADIPVVFAVANAGMDECSGPDPFLTSLPEVIAVGSSDNRDQRRTSSDFGDCLDLMAPGGLPDTLPGITTTDVVGTPGYNDEDAPSACMIAEGPDLAYTRCFSGASAAAPIVAGIIGLMRSQNPTISRVAAQKILEETADKIDPANAMYDVNGFSLTYGYGRVNAHKALETTGDVTPEPEEQNPGVEFGTRVGITTLSGGPNNQVVANLPGGGPFSAPILYATLFPATHWMIEGQLGFSFTSNSSAPNESTIVAALQPAYLFSGSSVPSAYFGANVAVKRFDVGGNVSTDTGSGIALGYRFLPFSFLAVRTEARYRYWFTDNISEFGVALAFGVVLGTTP